MKTLGIVLCVMIISINSCKTETNSYIKNPQFAIWVENSSGEYILTEFITKFSANKNWNKDLPKERPEALPVWNHKIPNTILKNEIDAVSSATPNETFAIEINDSLTNGEEYNIYLEVNQSYDYNDTWTKSNSGVNGQPSIIYHTEFIVGQNEIINLLPIGCGSVDGSNGDIDNNLDYFTTANKIIEKVNPRLCRGTHTV